MLLPRQAQPKKTELHLGDALLRTRTRLGHYVCVSLSQQLGAEILCSCIGREALFTQCQDGSAQSYYLGLWNGQRPTRGFEPIAVSNHDTILSVLQAEIVEVRVRDDR